MHFSELNYVYNIFLLQENTTGHLSINQILLVQMHFININIHSATRSIR